MEKEYKVIIAYTSWWISLIIKKINNKFAELLESGHLKFVTSDELAEEIGSTLLKQRLQKHLNKNLINFFWQQYTAFVDPVQVTSAVSVCRDPKDNFFITGDKDLLIIGKFEQTIICTLSVFIKNYLNK